MHAAVASGVDGNAMSAETRLGTLDRLPDDVLTIIVAQLYGRQMEDVNVWQARSASPCKNQREQPSFRRVVHLG